MYYAQARMYNQAVGRFASEDILKGDVHSPLSLNNYTYCWNQPLDFIDLDGLCRCCVREYIVRYAEARNPDYPEWDSNCANFVSQALAAGGIEHVHSPSQWFIMPAANRRNLPAWLMNMYARYSRLAHNIDMSFNNAALNNLSVYVSRSWNIANNQFDFFSNPNNGFINGPVLTVRRYTDIWAIARNMNVQVGDLIHMDLEGVGVINHAVIVSRVTNYDIYFSGNTSDMLDFSLTYWFRERRPDAVIHITRLNDSVFGVCDC